MRVGSGPDPPGSSRCVINRRRERRFLTYAYPSRSPQRRWNRYAKAVCVSAIPRLLARISATPRAMPCVRGPSRIACVDAPQGDPVSGRPASPSPLWRVTGRIVTGRVTGKDLPAACEAITAKQQRFRVDPQLVSNPLDRPTEVSGSFRASSAIRVARCCSSTLFFLGATTALISLPRIESLHQTRGDSRALLSPHPVSVCTAMVLDYLASPATAGISVTKNRGQGPGPIHRS